MSGSRNKAARVLSWVAKLQRRLKALDDNPRLHGLLIAFLLFLLFSGSLAVGAGIARFTSHLRQSEYEGLVLAEADSVDSPEEALGDGDSADGMGGPLEPWSGDSLSDELQFVEPAVDRLVPATYTFSDKEDPRAVLRRLKVPEQLIDKWEKLAEGKYDLSQARAGQTLKLYATPEKNFLKLELSVDHTQKLVIAKGEDEYRCVMKNLAPQGPFPGWVDPVSGNHYYRGEVRGNFLSSAVAAGMSLKKTQAMIEVFPGINFKKEVKTGAHFSVVVAPGKEPGEEGPLLAAMIMVKGKPRYVFRWEEKGRVSYVNEKGLTGRKISFICPVRAKRISSSYTSARLHPILRVVRPHYGVDFAAPSGTPVYAAAAGTVSFVGWRGGFGRTVLLQHGHGYETQYGHLSSYARRLKVGNRVQRGQVIGYVGASGLATGPHLDYRVYLDRKPINPLRKITLPDPPPNDISAFIKKRDALIFELSRSLPAGPPSPWPRIKTPTPTVTANLNTKAPTPDSGPEKNHPKTVSKTKKKIQQRR